MNTPSLLEHLRHVRLFGPEQLDALLQDLPGPTNDDHVVAQQLVERGWLTPYQAEQLLQGRGQHLTLGAYRLLEPLGEGGMGQVFKAVHARLSRLVALKIIRPDRLGNHPGLVRRFRREAMAAAQLAHPNVVLVYDADEVDGVPFIAMEYVQGSDLGRLVKRDGRLPIPQACDFIRQAALGLQHIHERGLIHRDIKPSNLLLGQPQSAAHLTPVTGISGFYPRPLLTRVKAAAMDSIDGAPSARPAGYPPEKIVKISDLGLVRLGEASADPNLESSLTREGKVVGTPDFVSPEQARDPRNADIRSDLYSLGCTFYYLLTGRLPFGGETPLEKLLKHQYDDPCPVGQLRPETPAPVQAVVLRLLAKRPEERYPSPGEVADALARQTLPAGPATPLPGTVVNVADLPPTPMVSIPAKATSSPKPVNPSLAPAQRLAVLKGSARGVTALAFSPNRDLLAAAGADGSVRLWDFSVGRPRELPLPRAPFAEVRVLAFAPDNRSLAVGAATRTGGVCLLDLSGPEPVVQAVSPSPGTSALALAFSPDGGLLAYGGHGGTVQLLHRSPQGLRPRGTFAGHADLITAVAFAPDGQTVAAGDRAGEVRLWRPDQSEPKVPVLIGGSEGAIGALAFAPDGQTLAAGNQAGIVRRYDLGDGGPAEAAVLLRHGQGVRLVVFPPDGQTLVSVCQAGQVVRWDLSSAEPLQEYGIPNWTACRFALTFDGRYLAADAADGTITVFRLGQKQKG